MLRKWRVPHGEGELAIKALVRERDGFRCTQCGMTNDQHAERYGKQLQVHRVRPGSHYAVDACVTLCMSCHGPLPKRAPGQHDENGDKFTFHLEQELLDALINYCDSFPHDVQKSQVVRDSLREFLKSKGFFPPKKDA